MRLLPPPRAQAEEGPALFWDFLKAASRTAEPADAAQCWSHILGMASSVLTPAMAQVRGRARACTHARLSLAVQAHALPLAPST